MRRSPRVPPRDDAAILSAQRLSLCRHKPAADITFMPPRSALYSSFWLAAALALVLFCIYNLNFRHGSTVDTISTTALPISILHEGNFDLDEMRGLMSTNTQALDAALKFFGGMQERDGHLVSSYPLGAAVMAVPF